MQDARCILLRGGSIDFQIVSSADMNTLELPSGKANLSVAAHSFALLENGQRSKYTNYFYVVARQQLAILRLDTAPDHDFIDDEVIALGSHGSNGMTHACQCSLQYMAYAKGNGGLSSAYIFGNEAVGVAEQMLRHHFYKGVHRYMEHGHASNCLHGACR
ncbi:hypothetical protein DFR52_101740 [Hoeflea marina]|uniref:Uncharacterized protein n=1 Tax=Hoeflea marina TaxID=274592 RepID=A0A317PX30_9HYPH|nr:hypothetical protein DFR52_101740 [Hoeflea marina]